MIGRNNGHPARARRLRSAAAFSLALGAVIVLLTGGRSVAGEAFQDACMGLADRTIPAALIGLPSGNAIVASVSFVPAAAQAKTPEFCKVLGTIAQLIRRRS